MTDATTDDRILSISRVIKTTPEELFEAWTDPRLLLKWWGPEGTTVPDYTFDIRVGGAWKTTMMNAAGDGQACADLALLKTTRVDLGRLPAGSYTVVAGSRRAPLTVG